MQNENKTNSKPIIDTTDYDQLGDTRLGCIADDENDHATA